jgi:ribosome recycling factor|tara:strand:+ start:104 stop:250 length:147 start_codon:yes stop_codon:yes gene_type:complete
MSKRSKGDNGKPEIDDFEDYGYTVKNIRRQTKNKVPKLKKEFKGYEDS